MSRGKVAVALLATVCGLVALFMFTNSQTGRTLLAKSHNKHNVQQEPWNAFNDFIKNHNKTYKSIEEMKERFEIFHANFYWVKVQNSRNLETTYAINQFSDLTQEEFESTYLGFNFDPDLQMEYAADEDIEVAEELDWETKGMVSAVKDQGQCGSCWSFSAVAALEGAWKQKTGKMQLFSEQQLVDCSTSQGNQGCNGGMPSRAFEYWKGQSAESESSYPYTAKDGTCKESSSKGVTKLSGYKSVTPNEKSLKSALNGRVISVAVDASDWKNYGSGIFSGKCNGLGLNHAVTLVGYGSEGGQDFWRIKNSWTTGWGEKGYIKLKKTNSFISWGECGIARVATYPTL